MSTYGYLRLNSTVLLSGPVNKQGIMFLLGKSAMQIFRKICLQIFASYSYRPFPSSCQYLCMRLCVCACMRVCLCGLLPSFCIFVLAGNQHSEKKSPDYTICRRIAQVQFFSSTLTFIFAENILAFNIWFVNILWILADRVKITISTKHALSIGILTFDLDLF